ncbi:MAG: DNA polymerase/3'-5' exonuclease PolX [Candidatus Levybacteria bacterium]|nr:DNA polymerase/3'-5' exonuclease PolX [Candidatus Levybacteria bacterium]
MTNHEIARLLRNVAAAYSIKNENKFRFQIIAYQKAAEAIENLNSELEELYRKEELDTIPGVGASLKSHLEELLKTGKVKHFDWVAKGIPKGVFPLLDVPTFGPKKAYKLVKHFKLNNEKTVIDDLEKAAKEGKIANLETFGEKSQEDILKAISEYKKGKTKTTRMVLPYASQIADQIVKYLKDSKVIIDAQPLGSLRRMMATVGDVDIAVATNNPKEAINYFINYPQTQRVIEKGPTTASIIVSGDAQIDLMTQPPESFGSLLQHFTGSKPHNIHLREYALRLGLSLSEYGIKKGGKTNKFASEEKFYEALGMEWIPPEIREDKGEIELAIAHKLPKLVKLEEIKGDLHIHSSYPIEPSHDLGKSSMEEMIKKAKELGYEYLGFSEHNPSVAKHTNNSIYSILEARSNKIEQLKKSIKNLRIINLLEVDILANGHLPIDDKSLTFQDAIIVGIHSSFSMDRDNMTKRVLNGLSHPKAKIFAHPTGRLLNQRPSYELDWEKIFDFCKKKNKALEINAWPYRLDLPDVLVKEAIKHGVKMVTATDAHNVSQMDLMRYGITVARRGWASKNDILNSLEYNKFIKWLKN